MNLQFWLIGLNSYRIYTDLLTELVSFSHHPGGQCRELRSHGSSTWPLVWCSWFDANLLHRQRGEGLGEGCWNDEDWPTNERICIWNSIGPSFQHLPTWPDFQSTRSMQTCDASTRQVLVFCTIRYTALWSDEMTRGRPLAMDDTVECFGLFWQIGRT